MNLASHTSASLQPKNWRPSLKNLWLPSVRSALGVACVATLASGLASCDSTAKIGLSDRKFFAIEAVTVFPVKLDEHGQLLGRVCGAALTEADGSPLKGSDGNPLTPFKDFAGKPIAEPGPSEANGIEVTANFMSTGFNTDSLPPCGEDDRDTSIKKGELIEQTPLYVPSYVKAGDFKFAERCVGPNVDLPISATPCATDADCSSGSDCYTDSCDPKACSSASDCGTSGVCTAGFCGFSTCNRKPKAASTSLDASTVAYKNIADRCDPGNAEATRINVALVIDNSGSMKGNVDLETLREDADGYYDQAQQPLTNVASDWYGYRVNSAEAFIASLNTQDRVIGYLFDEAGAKVASSNSFTCIGTTDPGDSSQPDPKFENLQCKPDSPETCGSGGACVSDPTLKYDDYAAGLVTAECLAFGSNVSERTDLVNGLELKRNAASGRSPVWQTVQTAYNFLLAGEQGCELSGLSALHIVVIADGPDTCVDSDEHNYMSVRNKDTSGKCRAPCQNATAKWHELLVTMAKAGYPVHVHFIQFQAPGYKDPDPRMMEMACRTDGTYQFINSESFNKSASGDFANALTRAVTRVRDGLSGTWRVNYPWTSVATVDQFPKGALRTIDGDFVFANTQFNSVTTAVHDNSPNAWRFTYNGAEDRRALVRIACTSDSDCGGAGDGCEANHCAEGGVCKAAQAPNGEPCKTGGKDGTCRNGACVAGQACATAIKP